MTCANIYPVDSHNHHVELVTEPGDDLPVRELPLLELIAENGEPTEPQNGGEAAFLLDEAGFKETIPFIADTCRVELVTEPDPTVAGLLGGLGVDEYFGRQILIRHPNGGPN